MKQIRMTVILVTLVLGGLSSCTKDNSGTATASTLTGKTNVKGDPGSIASTLQQGSWMAAYSDNAETNVNLTGYVFNFGQSNYLSAIYNGGVVYNGSWSVDESMSNVVIDFGTTPLPLSALEGSWHVTALNQSVVRLQRGDGSATLTFQKTSSGS
jgi:hypothetical protein